MLVVADEACELVLDTLFCKTDKIVTAVQRRETMTTEMTTHAKMPTFEMMMSSDDLFVKKETLKETI